MVIKTTIGSTDHYLAHEKVGEVWKVVDATTFGPNCIWYSGPDYNLTGNHHNYYFNDGVNNRFLSAPLGAGDVISLSPSTPDPNWLQNTDQIYYFYDWDRDNLPSYGEGGGLARGQQIFGVTQEECEQQHPSGWDPTAGVNGECWEAHYVEYRDGKWQMSVDSYNITSTGGRYRTVTITENTTVNSGGLGTLGDFSMTYGDQHPLSLNPTLPYAYTVNTNYRFYEKSLGAVTDHIVNTPGEASSVESYQWSISGDAKEYLSFASGSDVNTVSSDETSAATLYYRVENQTGDKTATLTLVVTYNDGATQTRTATVTVTTACQHPIQAAVPMVSFDDVTVSWYNVASSYVVKWKKKNSNDAWSQSAELSGTQPVLSYPIAGLEPNTTYQYKVEAKCGTSAASGDAHVYEFTTKEEAHALVYGAIYGGGRMANVKGKTEITIVNCDSIGAIFGGNDIAGEVENAAGSSIILGTSATTSDMKISSVYGGGNGYYTYDGHAPGAEIGTTVLTDGTFSTGVTDVGGTEVYATSGTIPSIVKTSITVANNYVTIDTIFGGAKNAFLTLDNATANGSSITINGGTVGAVFGGNNWGGTQKSAKHHIEVTNTKTGTDNAGLGRDFGIGYLFGGGNKVTGSATDILISGGMLDTVFGGGNQASVASALLVVDCEGDKIITNALSGGNLNPDYTWDGTGIYNVRALFGGNNRAPMAVVPVVTLTSGGIGTAYGGGNAGKMQASEPGSFTFDNQTLNFNYSTKMIMSSANAYVDNLYGGCQMSDVDYSTWVEITGGNVGTVYGGCNISGDVGSVRTDMVSTSPSTGYQSVRGATFVHAHGGTVHKNLFAGSNGYYHCNNGVEYIAGVNFADPLERYVGMRVPSHNETNVFMSSGTTVEGDVFAGGNLACVGFTDWTIPSDYGYGHDEQYPQFVGLAAVHMDGGLVKGNVFGGGSMASVYGSNEVSVSGGEIQGALYGGNDKTGQVAQITNRVMPSLYDYASDHETSLADVRTYVSVTGSPTIGTVYGGGNGDYDYDQIQYCGYSPDKPIQSNTFVDIAINSGSEGGKINAVYGGGNGVTSQGTITVFYNAQGNDVTYDNVKTIFGGNNKGELTNVVPDIILYKGRVHDVYGGCNSGAMIYDEGFAFNKTVILDANGDGTAEQTYENVGSYVRLLKKYKTHDVTATISGNVYGGCRMNGVEKTSLVLVEDRDYSSATIFGGSDISGTVEGTSHVVVAGTVGDVYGGGNGNYDYVNEGNVHEVYVAGSSHTEANLIATNTFEIKAPYCANSRVDMLGGACIANHDLYAGGYAGLCGTTQMNVEGGTVNDNVFGGGNMAGTTTSFTYSYAEPGNPNNILSNTIEKDGSSTVNVTGGSVLKGVYGGCNATGTIAGNVDVNVLSNLGASGTPMVDGIFGGGYGSETGTAGHVTVTIDKANATATAPTVYADVYGGSALGQVNNDTDDLTKIDFKNGNLHGNIFGGGKGQVADPNATPDPIPGIAAIVNGNVQVAVSGGNLFNNVYGGCNLNGYVVGAIDVDVTGGNIGTTTATADVFGGGYGHNTTTEGNVTVTVGTATGATTAPVIYGDVYGGSGFGDVNTALGEGNTPSDDVTTVNVLAGSIKKTTGGNGGNVYGGGLGDDNNPAHVNGKVYVNIGAYNSAATPNYTGNAIIENAVYGCNNENGTPLDDVFVNIYKTNHSGNNVYPSTTVTTVVDLLALGKTDDYFALNAVYGGGNKAAYTPPVVNNARKTATVHVYTCDNTIKNVYGGGNAADVGIDETDKNTNTMVIVDGGRIYQVFGGGNGAGEDNPGANIYGTATSYIYAGLINEVYGGANINGSIDVIDLNLPGNSTTGCDEVFGSVFGCANEAPLNHSITTTVSCGVGPIGELYGGSNLARIGVENTYDATVTLNLYGGEYDQVFGGSKGVAPATGVEGIAAPIWGNVVLNLYGGTIGEAFGGCDQNGNVFGEIQVNVLDIENNDCPLVLTDVYGASNQTAYQPNYTPASGDTRLSPVVNVIHVKEKTVSSVNVPGILGNVYGGGKEGAVTSNPVVNIGYDATVMGALNDEEGLLYSLVPSGYTEPTGGFRAYVKENVLGGGKAANVTGTATVNLRKANSRVNKLFGGGDHAGTSNSIVNVIDGTVATAVYGGCNDQGNITNNINVNIQGGTLGTSSTNTVNVFGGGYGENTSTTGDITVTFGGTGVTPILYGDIYGGSALGVVNNTKDNNAFADHLTKVEILTGTVNGTVFGGGFGQVTGSEIAAHAYGNTKVDVQGGTITTAIYGGCNVNGEVWGSTTVELTGGTVGASDNRAQIFGGGFGQKTKVKRNVTVNFGDLNAEQSATPTLYGELYGGSAKGDVNTATATATPYTTQVNLNNGTITGTNTGAGNAFVYGAAYGGALGQTASQGGLIEAKVYGKIYVKVGEGLEENAKGNATLTYCNIYGCNNAAGCPQDQVYVDVYKTAHTDTDDVDEEVPENNLEDPIYYAIHQVFGGGNEADFNVQGVTGLKTNVHIYNCDNTVYRVFGGGNAADVPGVNLDVQGGRYDWVFGGGNGELGQSYAANITENINISIGGGLIQFLVNGSNMHGTVAGDINETPYEGCETLITNHFCGSNSDDIFGDVVVEYFCPSDKRYVNLYGGSNYAQIYGDIHLTIRGGEFQNVFGGSRGRLEDLTQNISGIASSVHKITQEDIDEHPELTQADLGRGGNVYITITGGAIGNLYGACDINGNVEGVISIIVEENDDACSLFLGNIYGAGNHTDYNPSIPANGFESFISPEIKILNGTVGGGFNFDHSTEANPIINTSTTTEIYEGNIFGGGNIGEVVSNPQIIIGDKLHPNNKITIEGDVFGGGDHGSVTGSPKVIIAPTE